MGMDVVTRRPPCEAGPLGNTGVKAEKEVRRAGTGSEGQEGRREQSAHHTGSLERRGRLSFSQLPKAWRLGGKKIKDAIKKKCN